MTRATGPPRATIRPLQPTITLPGNTEPLALIAPLGRDSMTDDDLALPDRSIADPHGPFLVAPHMSLTLDETPSTLAIADHIPVLTPADDHIRIDTPPGTKIGITMTNSTDQPRDRSMRQDVRPSEPQDRRHSDPHDRHTSGDRHLPNSRASRGLSDHPHRRSSTLQLDTNLQRGPFILSELICRYHTYKKLDGSYENISYLVKSEQP